MTAGLAKKILFGLLVLGVAGGGTWWAMPKKIAAADRYVTASMERGPITQSVAANGTLNPVVLVNVGSQISGIVKELHADFNDRVKAGQILLKLDPALSQAQLQQSEANLFSAKASVDLAQANETRERGLVAQGYDTQQNLDMSIQAFKAAQAQFNVAKAQVERDRTNLAYTVIRSPVDGVVVSRQVDLGQTVAASFQTPTLFQIAQSLSKMQIDSSYAEADVGNIRVGQPATFRVDAFPDRTFRGVVRQVRLNPTVQQNVVTYDVVVAVDNPDQVLMPGMTAYVNITVAQSKDALLVPNAALRFRPVDAAAGKNASRGGNRPKGTGKEKDATPMGTVYVIRGGLPVPLRIGLGITDNRMTEVRGSELKENDKVIVEDSQPPAKDSNQRGMRLF